MKILWHTPKYIFCWSVKKKKRYPSELFTPDCYGCVGCCHCLFDHLREKRSVHLAKWSGSVCFRHSAAHRLEIAGPHHHFHMRGPMKTMVSEDTWMRPPVLYIIGFLSNCVSFAFFELSISPMKAGTSVFASFELSECGTQHLES